MSKGSGWHGSNRRAELPANWPELRAAAHDANPTHICWKCGKPGGEAVDHKDGNPHNNDQDNLDWIHDWRSVRDGRSDVNCHSFKTAGDRVRRRTRAPEIHPGTGQPYRWKS